MQEPVGQASVMHQCAAALVMQRYQLGTQQSWHSHPDAEEISICMFSSNTSSTSGSCHDLSGRLQAQQ
jgi:hypothetical protein